MLDKRISREGTLLMKGGEVFLDGWEIHPGGMCREVAILACLYTARRLLEFASRLTREGGSAPVCSDMPRETPRDWLCPRTREFDAMFESSAQETRPECQHKWTVIGAPVKPDPDQICEGGCGQPYSAFDHV